MEQYAMLELCTFAHLHRVKAEAEDVVDGVIADDVEDIMEDEEGDVQVPKDQLMPRGSHRS